jgi:glycosyltransferase involved in cell wall biosynthesis
VPTLLSAADFAILSSWEEGFCNVILEAMAAGLPMIVTDVGGNPEAVLHEAALGEAVLRLSRDADLRNRLGEAGQRRVKQEFSVAIWRHG